MSKRAISLRPLVAEPDPEQVAELVAEELDRQMKAREREDWDKFVAQLSETARERLKKMVTEPDKAYVIANEELAETIRKSAQALDDQFINGTGSETPKGVLSPAAQKNQDAWKMFNKALILEAKGEMEKAKKLKPWSMKVSGRFD